MQRKMLGRLLSGKAIGTDELVVRDTKFLDADENIDWEKWAPNGGRVPGTIKENQTIPAGTIIDRYGSQWGKYTSPAGVPYEQRALPYIENPNAYHKYEVLKPIDFNYLESKANILHIDGDHNFTGKYRGILLDKLKQTI